MITYNLFVTHPYPLKLASRIRVVSVTIQALYSYGGMQIGWNRLDKIELDSVNVKIKYRSVKMFEIYIQLKCLISEVKRSDLVVPTKIFSIFQF